MPESEDSPDLYKPAEWPIQRFEETGFDDEWFCPGCGADLMNPGSVCYGGFNSANPHPPVYAVDCAPGDAYYAPDSEADAELRAYYQEKGGREAYLASKVIESLPPPTDDWLR